MENMSINELKMQYNNEVIKLQPYVLQAKTQVINSLSKKIKLLKNKKGNEKQKLKYKRKVENLISEIMLLKHIKRNDVSSFALQNMDNLGKIINTPSATKEKAMAKVISHKSLMQRFFDIKSKYSLVPVIKLLEQNPKKLGIKKRKERKKLKKNKEINKDGVDFKTSKCHEEAQNRDNNISEEEEEKIHKAISTASFHVEASCDSENVEKSLKIKHKNMNTLANNDNLLKVDKGEIDYDLKPSSTTADSIKSSPNRIEVKKNGKTKRKAEINWIDSNEIPGTFSEKTVDSFFVTDNGKNYMTLALPRSADKVLAHNIDETTNGTIKNRKMRRAAMFGNDILTDTRKNKKRSYESSFNEDYIKKKPHSEQVSDSNKFGSSKNKLSKKLNLDKIEHTKEEELHPSWQARKQQSNILPFKGNKIVFD